MMKLNGRLSNEQMSDLNRLILKLQAFNRSNLIKNDSGKKIELSEIRPIPSSDNSRLWEYIRHICRMAVLNGRNFISIQAICNRDRRNEVHDLVNEAVNEMCIHVYRYVWRDYVDSDSEGYVYGAAYQAFKTWRDKQNDRMNNNDRNRQVFDLFSGDIFGGTHKVSNIKPS